MLIKSYYLHLDILTRIPLYFSEFAPEFKELLCGHVCRLCFWHTSGVFVLNGLRSEGCLLHHSGIKNGWTAFCFGLRSVLSVSSINWTSVVVSSLSFFVKVHRCCLIHYELPLFFVFTSRPRLRARFWMLLYLELWPLD